MFDLVFTGQAVKYHQGHPLKQETISLQRKRLSLSAYMMFRLTLSAKNCRTIALSSFRQGYVKALPPLTGRILTPQLAATSNCKYSMLYSPIQSAKSQRKLLVPQTCIPIQLARQCSEKPHFYVKECDLNNKILEKRTVQDHLEFYLSNKDEVSLINRITLLYHIAKRAHQYAREKEVLDKDREKVKHGQESAYIDILDFISEHISSCKAQGLANVMWALGRIGEKTHALVRVCEEEIISHDFSIFHTAEINQILTACAALGLKDSPIFERVEESILKEIIRISMCETRQIAGILTAFASVGCGSVEFFDHVEYKIIQRGLKNFHNGQIAQFVYAFAARGIHSNVLFEKVEEEILRRSTVRLRRKEMVLMLWSFATAGMGSEELFNALGEEIVNHRIREYYNNRLVWIIWSFATRGIMDSNVYKVIAEEIYTRGLEKLTNGELSLCMYSYALSEIPCRRFLEKLTAELLARDLASFPAGQLAQVVWACGKAGVENPELFCRSEEKILQLKLTQYEASMLHEGFRNADMGSKNLFSHLEAMMQQSS